MLAKGDRRSEIMQRANWSAVSEWNAPRLPLDATGRSQRWPAAARARRAYPDQDDEHVPLCLSTDLPLTDAGGRCRPRGLPG